VFFLFLQIFIEGIHCLMT